MKNYITSLLFLLILVVFASSCGRTVYRAKYTKSNKYIKHAQRNHFWHAHHYRARQHAGGYW